MTDWQANPLSCVHVTKVFILETLNAAEWRHLYSSMSVTPNGASTFYWLGARSESAGPAAWRWANGSTPLERWHASWRDGKPEFGRNKCLLMQDIDSFRIQDSWRDYRCTAKFRFVCEIHVPSAEKLTFNDDAE